MTRHVLRAVDLGASVVFMAFCAKAFVTHFYKDLRLQQRQQKFAVVSDAALLTPQLLPLPAQSRSHHPHQPSSC
jgi:hypothetical protein